MRRSLERTHRVGLLGGRALLRQVRAHLRDLVLTEDGTAGGPPKVTGPQEKLRRILRRGRDLYTAGTYGPRSYAEPETR
jgi:hypothetical protein